MNYEYKNIGTNEDGLSKLFAAIGKCQGEFPALLPSATGQKGHQKFTYVPLDKIIDGIKPQLQQYGVTFIQLLHSADGGSAITLLVVGHGAVISTTFRFARDLNPQDAGKQTTYYRRYQLTAFFGIVGDPDADSDSVEENKKKYLEKEQEEHGVGSGTNGDNEDHSSPRLRIETSTSIPGLKNIWSEFTPEEKKECKPYLDKRKKELDAEEVKTSREPGEEG